MLKKVHHVVLALIQQQTTNVDHVPLGWNVFSIHRETPMILSSLFMNLLVNAGGYFKKVMHVVRVSIHQPTINAELVERVCNARPQN